MKLTISERLILLGVLPKEGNFATLKIIRKLNEELSFNEDEFKKYDIVQDGDQVRWDADADAKEQKDISIGEKATDIIVSSLRELDGKNKLNNKHITLYEKFVENKSEV